MEKTVDTKLIYNTGMEKSHKFPRRVFLIILNEFCERFSYSGMRAFLAIYLKHKLLYSDNEATEVYHIFTTMAYFFPIFGAILADSFLGKFRTILYLMIVYAIGNLLVAVTAIPPLGIPGREFTILGLALVSLGTGGIKPCVSAFGGDQFKLPEQEKQLTSFFSLFYFTICFASFIAKAISPLIRSEIHCFGDKYCYSAAFGLPGILILISIILFICGKRLYIIKKPKRNIILDVMKCIYTAVKTRFSEKSAFKEKEHWLDYAKDDHDHELISDIKQTLSIFLLFLPLPIYWSLIDQLGSRWTLQATKMNGKFGNITFKPDQIQVLAPSVVLIFIPIFKKIVYPYLEKRQLMHKAYHKLIAGCILAGISFILSGVLETHLEKTYPILPSKGVSQLRIFNGLNCDLQYNNTLTGEYFTVRPLQFYENETINVEGNRDLIYNKTIICANSTIFTTEKINLEENKAISRFYNDYDKNGVYQFLDDTAKSRSGLPLLRILTNAPENRSLNISLYNIYRKDIEIETNNTKTKLYEVFSGKYLLYVNSQLISLDINLDIGGVYNIMITGIEENNIEAKLLVITESNSISMGWIIPQLVIISISEVLYAITGLEFAFKEAPESMKSVLQAYWLFTEAIGNIIIIIVTRLGSNYRLVGQFYFFAVLITISTSIFYILMKRYERIKARKDGAPISYELVMQNEKHEALFK